MITINRAAVAGAIALNIPTLYWMTQLSAAATALAAVALAAVGAGLGALVAFGLGQPSRKAVALPRSHSRDLERAA